VDRPWSGTGYDEHEDAEKTKTWIEKAGRKCVLMPGDVQDYAHCRHLVRRTVSELGGLNIIVNNAAYHIEARGFRDIPPERLERTFRTNIFSCIWLAQEAARHVQAGDTIINTGSVVAFMPYPQLTDYAATKAAILNFTKNIAAGLAKEGIRVNCVAPGPVWTPLIASTGDKQFVGTFGDDSLWGGPTIRRCRDHRRTELSSLLF
jgi:NAD(P)-dependent dehydrogenase (short-subunit alcohol dehydrogenase family)